MYNKKQLVEFIGFGYDVVMQMLNQQDNQNEFEFVGYDAEHNTLIFNNNAITDSLLVYDAVCETLKELYRVGNPLITKLYKNKTVLDIPTIIINDHQEIELSMFDYVAISKIHEDLYTEYFKHPINDVDLVDSVKETIKKDTKKFGSKIKSSLDSVTEHVSNLDLLNPPKLEEFIKSLGLKTSDTLDKLEQAIMDIRSKNTNSPDENVIFTLTNGSNVINVTSDMVNNYGSEEFCYPYIIELNETQVLKTNIKYGQTPTGFMKAELFNQLDEIGSVFEYWANTYSTI